MASNPLMDALPKTKRGGIKMSPQEWAARGNAFGEEIGRTDVHWYVHDGQLCIGWKGPPESASAGLKGRGR